MQKIIECVPNFSEGKNLKKIAAIVAAIKSVPGIALLDQTSDDSHNRSVITFAGEPESVIKAAFLAVKKAAALIDMDKHSGVHPRLGATDVLPLIPLKGVSIKECVRYALKLGKRIGEELKIPVYMYEKAAKRADRKNLADVRRGEYEELKKEIEKNPQRKPDFGPSKLGKAGATAVGARLPLIAFNVNLASKNLQIAKEIAKKIRFKDSGFSYVKAIGLELKNPNCVQVSINFTNYKKTPVNKVFQKIAQLAKKYGVKILESEIIGLIPRAALIKDAKKHWKIKNFSKDKILEEALKILEKF